jgi:hypothetical protein
MHGAKVKIEKKIKDMLKTEVLTSPTSSAPISNLYLM